MIIPFLGIHVCMDEIMAVMMLVPCFRPTITRISLWWHSRKHGCCSKHHKDTP